MTLSERRCPECNTKNFKAHTTYTVNQGEQRTLYHCQECGAYFSETKNTPLEGLKTPISRISLVLEVINDGMGLNAACRTFHVGKNSIKRWLSRLVTRQTFFQDLRTLTRYFYFDSCHHLLSFMRHQLELSPPSTPLSSK